MRWMIVILGLLLSGCMVHYQQPRYQGPPPLQVTSIEQVNAMVGAQQPAAYKVGFMGGCDSGHLSTGNAFYIFKKDTVRFETDDAYKQGWNDGFNRCASGGGISSRSYSSQRYYPYYYPYYSPGYSLWLGYYGYPRYSHWHYVYRHNYYYTP